MTSKHVIFCCCLWLFRHLPQCLLSKKERGNLRKLQADLWEAWHVTHPGNTKTGRTYRRSWGATASVPSQPLTRPSAPICKMTSWISSAFFVKSFVCFKEASDSRKRWNSHRAMAGLGARCSLQPGVEQTQDHHLHCLRAPWVLWDHSSHRILLLKARKHSQKYQLQWLSRGLMIWQPLFDGTIATLPGT